jgi:hypothetical protein
MGRSQLPPLSKIQIGEPDANAEYFSALRTKTRPIFLDCFFVLPQFPLDEFLSGSKFIVYGQKGTGKTTVLRHLAAKANAPIIEFLIFKKAFLEEIDLQEFSKLPLMLDEESIKKFKHYHHTLKRLLVLIILSKVLGSSSEPEIEEIADDGLKSLLGKIASSSVGDAIRFGMDSIASIFTSVGLDLQKITDGKLLLQGGKLLKRNNDDLLNILIRRLKRQPKAVRLFLDEIHFAYRSEESLQQDAILVRDTVLAVQTLNERFSEENLDIIIYVAVRSEYLEHPIISTADINHAIESVGHELTWSNFPPNKNHPLFQLVLLRFQQSIGRHFRLDDLFRVYLSSMKADLFLARTWSKPRDFIRYFKCAKKLYPHKAFLSTSQSNAVWRNYSQEAWREIKSSASPFLSPEALSLFEETFAKIAPEVFDGSVRYDVISFGELFRPVYEIGRKSQVNFYDFDHFVRLLYILGIFLTRRHDAFDQHIYYSYHRGNRNFHANGDVMIHPTVLKAFG